MKKLIIILVFFMLGTTAVFGADIVSEESLKVAFIFNFLKFVQWDDGRPQYDICVPDDEPLRKAAAETLDGKKLNNRQIEVVDRTDLCHILVSNGAPPLSDTTLTIGSLDQGSMFEFEVIDNKLKFAINVNNIKKSKLKISSQLLKLAITKE